MNITIINFPIVGDYIPSLLPGGNYKISERFYSKRNETYFTLTIHFLASSLYNW